MSTPGPDKDDREERLGAAVFACLQALESGERLGEPELRARYPELADELLEYLAGRQDFERLAGPLRALAPSSQPAADSRAAVRAGSFGDYELLEEIGQGGMGVVYKARQVSLNRLVAVKMIRAGVWASTAEVRRFRQEAETAAALDHPHIVPVYEVGEWEGHVYLALKLVEGGDLAVRLAPYGADPRAAARLVADVARAVHHAHQRGILHRDLKPSNVLLDGEGRPHVTDFGLAKRTTGEAGLTESGAILGTPGYMAPEQAAGAKGLSTTATDVYGLGALLYVLLTGKPPFEGDSVLETLTRVREREPESPSGRNRQVGRDLEAICLKCLEKEPPRRYGSAEAVAEDLECWLAGRPIAARRVTAWGRFWRWCRRNPVLAGLAAAAGLLSAVTIAALSVSTLQTRAAYEAEAVHRRRAERHYHAAREAVDQMLTRVADERLADVPQMEPVRRELLEQAVQFYQDFLEEDSADPAVRQETGRAYRRLAAIYNMLGPEERVEDNTRRAVTLFEKLVAEFPGNPDYRQDLEESYTALGWLYFATWHRRADAARAYGAALVLQKMLVAEFPARPAYRKHLANTLCALGKVKSDDDQLQEAEQLLGRSVDLLEVLVKERPDVADYRSSLGYSLGVLGEALLRRGRAYEAERAYRRKQNLCMKLVADFPNSPDYRDQLGDAHLNMARVMRQVDRLQETVRQYREALSCWQKNAADFPRVRDYRHRVGVAQAELAEVLKILGRLAEAEQAYRRALALQEKLVEEAPALPGSRWALFICRTKLAGLLTAAGRFAEAEKLYREAVTDYDLVLDRDPMQPRGHPDGHNDLAWLLANCPDSQVRDVSRAVRLARRAVELAPGSGRIWNTLGVAHYRAGEWQAAVAALEKSRELLAGQAESYNTFFLAMACWRLGDQERARRWYGEAVRWMEKHQPHDEELRRFRGEAAALLGLEKSSTPVAQEVPPRNE
jgi:tetratricopeptide (TPR) repeat protein